MNAGKRDGLHHGGRAFPGGSTPRGNAISHATTVESEKSPGSFTAFGLRAEAEPIRPGLHVVATPIGNLGDISFRALATLASADAIVAEDTRVTKTLLAHYGIATPLVAYHEHNAAVMRPHLLARLAAGASLALVSDAGTPLISDPGFKLVSDALAQNIEVVSVPGASAVLAALVVAGLPTDRFFFEGFLPPKSAARRTRSAIWPPCWVRATRRSRENSPSILKPSGAGFYQSWHPLLRPRRRPKAKLSSSSVHRETSHRSKRTSMQGLAKRWRAFRSRTPPRWFRPRPDSRAAKFMRGQSNFRRASDESENFA